MNASRNAVLAAALTALVAARVPAQDALQPVDDTNVRVVRSTHLVGVQVKGAEGEKIGELKDLVVDEENACVAFAIVATGGDKLLAIPFQTVQRSGPDGALSCVVATPEIAKAPTFDAKNWPVFDRAYATKVYDFYKAKPYWKEAAPHEAKLGGTDVPPIESTDPTPPARAPTVRANERGPAMRTCRLTKVVGEALQDSRDKKVGELEDVLVDDASGRVAYAVFSTGGLLGVGERMVALPWRSLKPGAADGKPHILDASPERIDKAPSFEKKSWPDLSDRRLGSEIHRYWDQTPYWDMHIDETEVVRHG
jgi:sporulation protein YlmC with PRC-barrel domain